MHNRRKLAHFLICFLSLALLFAALPVSAEEAALPSVSEPNAALLLHLNSGETVIEKNADLRISAGSTPKIMTGLIACEVLADRCDETVTVNSAMLAKVGGWDFDLRAGDQLTVEQLLYLAFCGSYNDACDVLAFVISGSLEAFADEMNRRARALGCTETLFTDASGIDDSSYTTVRELSEIARAASENSLYMEITSTTRYHFTAPDSGESHTVHNRNALIASNTTTLYNNQKCRGMNAGSTSRAGNCVVTLATDGEQAYLCIVMGAPDADEKNYGYLVANRLIDWVFTAYTELELLSPDTLICTIPVTVSDMTSEVEVRTKDGFSAYLPTATEIGTDITYSIRLLYDSLEAPVTEGLMVGYVAVLYQGRSLQTLPLYTAGSAERSSFISSLKSIQALTESRVFRAGAIFFLVALTAWIVTETVLIRRRRHKWDKYFSMKMNPSPTSKKPSKKQKH